MIEPSNQNELLDTDRTTCFQYFSKKNFPIV